MELIRLNRKSSYLPALLLGLAFVCPTNTLAYDKDTYAKQRKDFVAAEKALKRKQITRYRRIASKLTDYPLYPYLKYREIRRRLGKAKAEDIREFLTHHRKSPLANKLRHAWLKHLARTRKWQQLVDNFYLVNSTGLKCHYARALFEIGDHRAIDVTKELWRTGKSVPNSCNYAFRALRKANILNDALVWERIRLAMSAGHPRLAKFLAREMLSVKDQKWVNLWARIRRKPNQIKKAQALNEHESVPVVRWVIIDGIRSLARRDELKATRTWIELKDEYPFTVPERQRLNAGWSISCYSVTTNHL